MVRKAKPRRRWFWGFFILLLIAPLIALGMKDRIEKDLTKRSIAALRAADISWAKPDFIGLDGIIKGEAPSPEERLKAIDIVGKVYGVRRVADKLSLTKTVSPFIWSGRHEKGKIVLEGFVPNKKVRQSVIGLAKAKFPQANIDDDQLKVARGAPDDEEWFGQISYGIGQLSRMSYGTVSLSDKTINIIGSALDDSAFTGLKDTFKGELPLKMSAGSINIKPPVVENYFLNGKYDATSILLEGVVPDEESRSQLQSSVASLYPGRSFKNNLRLGDGAPNDWFKAVLLSLTELSKLDNGVFVMKERDIKFEGVASDRAIAKGVRTQLRSAYPTGYKVDDEISVKTAELELVSPFELRIAGGAEKIILKGYVSNESEREALLAAVKSSYPDATVTDELALAKGAPLNFLDGVRAGLVLLPSIGNAQLLLSDEQLTISGDTKAEAVAKRFEVKPDGLPANIDWINGVQFDDSEIKALEEEKRKKAVVAAEAEAKAKAEAETQRIEAEKAEADRLAKEKSEQEKAAAAAKAIADAKAKAEAKAKADEAAKAKADEEAKAKADAKAEAAKAEAAKAKAEAEAKKVTDNEKVTNSEELAKKRQWLSPEETSKRLTELHKESGAVNAKECQLLMNSIVRGNAIRFGVNSSVITSSSYDILSKVYSVASRCTNTVIRVEGHTDSDGSDAYNQELSLRRARSVISHLGELGIPRNRLDTKGFGEKQPVASNGTADGKALNRRIEFIVFEN